MPRFLSPFFQRSHHGRWAIGVAGFFFLWSILMPLQYASAALTCCNCKPPGSSDNTCLTVDSERLTEGQRVTGPCTRIPTLSQTLQGWSCEPNPLSDAKCHSVPQNGICVKGPQDAFTAEPPTTGDAIAKKNATVEDKPATIPNLNVQIPGFQFTGSESVTKNTSSLLAQYVSGAYRYLISISAVAATIMFVWGAFKYLLGSANIGSITRGKQIMQDAVIGMLLVLGSHLILRTINPDTLSLKTLYIEGVNPLLVGEYRYDVVPSEDQLSRSPVGKPADAEARIIAGTKMVAGIDPCMVLAVCEHESGLRPLYSGQLSGGPRNTATAFGPCQQSVNQMGRGNGIASRTKSLFPDFPVGSSAAGSLSIGERVAVGEWFNRNYVGAGYVAALQLKNGLAGVGGNEPLAVASYYGGLKSILNWKQANNCTPKPGLKLRNGNSIDLRNDACIADYVAVPTIGDEPKGCPEDLYNCPNAHVNERAEFVGQCSNPPRKCYAAQTAAYVRDVIRRYAKFAAKYDCSPSTSDATAPPAFASQQSSAGGSLTNTSVLLIGDSLSVGINITLPGLTRKAGNSYDFAGHEGATFQDWAPGGQYYGELQQHLAKNPKVILVSLGTNGEYIQTTAGANIEIAKIDPLIATLQKVGTIYWIGPPTLPNGYGGPGRNPNGLIIPAIKSRIAADHYFDSAQLQIPRQGPTNPHPTVQGYSQWATAIFSWLK